jgi:hypothetical protein
VPAVTAGTFNCSSQPVDLHARAHQHQSRSSAQPKLDNMVMSLQLNTSETTRPTTPTFVTQSWQGCTKCRQMQAPAPTASCTKRAVKQHPVTYGSNTHTNNGLTTACTEYTIYPSLHSVYSDCTARCCKRYALTVKGGAQDSHCGVCPRHQPQRADTPPVQGWLLPTTCSTAASTSRVRA